MTTKMEDQLDRKIDWQPLRELALKTPYTMEYLSLMARRKQLKVKKVGRLWYSTLRNIREFEKEMKERKDKRKEQMRKKYYKKSGISNIKVKVSQASIFDQIQKELEEVLEEIRMKERRLREEYRSVAPVEIRIDPSARSTDLLPPTLTLRRAGRMIKKPEEDIREKYLQTERQETEELSEKLIMDLGKLLNTANQIQEDAVTPERASHELHKLKNREEHQIPIRNQVKSDFYQEPSTEFKVKDNHNNHSPFLSLNYPAYGREQQETIPVPEEYYYQNESTPVEKRNWLGIIMFLIAGLLILISAIFILFLIYEI